MRSRSAAIWEALHAHPFLRELAEGSLPLEKFRFFVEQDNFFLADYGRCLAIGASKSRADAELRYFVSDLRNVLEAELPGNNALLSRLIEMGAQDRGGSAAPAPATVAYTSYMEALANRHGSLEIMAAVLPCAWSYIEIATGLAAGVSSSRHEVYSSWISFFSMPENVALVERMRADLDRRVEEERVSQTRRRNFELIFATSSRLELMFWDMAYHTRQWPDVVADGRKGRGPA